MAAISLVEQHIVFVVPNSGALVDDGAIRANTLIQSLASNSQGNDIIEREGRFWNWNGTVWTPNNFYELICYVLSTFVPTILTNMPNLVTALPQYNIYTWGISASFGY